mgnify:CR=1 FL=1
MSSSSTELLYFYKDTLYVLFIYIYYTVKRTKKSSIFYFIWAFPPLAAYSHSASVGRR